jgi:hypothetical protein
MFPSRSTKISFYRRGFTEEPEWKESEEIN